MSGNIYWYTCLTTWHSVCEQQAFRCTAQLHSIVFALDVNAVKIFKVITAALMNCTFPQLKLNSCARWQYNYSHITTDQCLILVMVLCWTLEEKWQRCKLHMTHEQLFLSRPFDFVQADRRLLFQNSLMEKREKRVTHRDLQRQVGLQSRTAEFFLWSVKGKKNKGCANKSILISNSSAETYL